MNILFVVPGWPKDSFWDVLFFKFPPLSIATLAGLTPSHHTFSYADESIAPVHFESQPDLVAITIMTPLSHRGYIIADRFRKMGVKVIIGGIHASNMPDEAAEHSDAVVIGEADEIWVEILQDAEQGNLKPRYSQSDFTRMERIPPADRSIYPDSNHPGLPLSLRVLYCHGIFWRDLSIKTCGYYCRRNPKPAQHTRLHLFC